MRIVHETLTTPWLSLFLGTWSTETGRTMFCDSFWPYFDWDQPIKGKQLRLVMSMKPVHNAQETRLVRSPAHWHWTRHR
jgi:hypothetical protein